jgi:hypothetical protein
MGCRRVDFPPERLRETGMLGRTTLRRRAGYVVYNAVVLIFRPEGLLSGRGDAVLKLGASPGEMLFLADDHTLCCVLGMALKPSSRPVHLFIITSLFEPAFQWRECCVVSAVVVRDVKW